MSVWMWMLGLAVAGEPLILNERDVQRESCERGEAKECTSLGLRYQSGRGAPKDPHYALDLFKKGCEHGDPTSCVYRADAYRNGDGVVRNAERAVKLYTAACAGQNFGRACRALGELYILGDGVERDAATSGVWYEQGCELDDAESCVGGALGIERGDMVSADPQLGRMMLSKACSLHNARGCTLLGRRYYNGFGGAEKDLDLASAMFQAGCGLQDPEACREIGLMSFKGKGMPKDREGAAIYFADSCAWDDYEACGLLAKMKAKTKDWDPAINAARRGCDLGDSKACGLQERLVWKKQLHEQQ